MKKIFILTAEPSGDKLAAKVISKFKIGNPHVNYLSLGGENLKKIGIESILKIEDVTYLGFTKVILNIFKIKKNINYTVKRIVEFNPDILFSVDSPDFTLRVCEIIKKKNPKIKTVHFVAPQVWIWRQGRVKKMKKFIDHILVLFKFEKKYFENEGINCEFVGHPLLEKEQKNKVDIHQLIEKNKAIISVFPGSRLSEVRTLMPILIDFIKLMNKKYNDFIYTFHTTVSQKDTVKKFLLDSGLSNFEIISDDKIKKFLLKKSIFAIAKSGTVSLEICLEKIPSIIIYKINFINYLILKLLVKVKYANILNIASNKMIIPELLQSNCNAENIYKNVNFFIENPNEIKKQLKNIELTLDTFMTKNLPSDEVSNYLKKLISF